MKTVVPNFKSARISCVVSNLQNLFLKIFLGFFCWSLLAYSEICQQSIRYGIHICFNTLIPSLFPFMIIAAFAADSEIFKKPNRVFSKITEKLFYLPGYTYPAIILSFIGGYPVGAKAIKVLHQKGKINSEQLNRMMYFCVNSGPAFTISILGNTLLKNNTLGLIIFLIQIALGNLIGIICGIKSKISKKVFYFSAPSPTLQKNTLREAFVDSVASGCEAIIQMCGIVIVFTAFIKALDGFEFLNFIEPLLSKTGVSKSIIQAVLVSIFEVTCGCIHAVKSRAPYWTLAFAIGYGGICTHLQIASILKGTNFKYSKFCMFRLINAFLSALIFYLISYFFPVTSPTFSTMVKTHPLIKSSSSPIGSIALIILCFYFLADIKLNGFSKKQK